MAKRRMAAQDEKKADASMKINRLRQSEKNDSFLLDELKVASETNARNEKTPKATVSENVTAEQPTKLRAIDLAKLTLYIDPDLYKSIRILRLENSEALDGKSISAYFSEMVEERIREIKSSTPTLVGN
jgi:hypothetical protein